MHQPRSGGKPLSGTIDELVQRFAAAGKPRERWRVGAEHEKVGVVTATGLPVPYHGARGVEAFLTEVARRSGWDRVEESGRVIGLSRPGLSVSLEPGGQLELAGAPCATQAEIEGEIAAHLDDIRPVSREMGIAWLGVGFRPFGGLDDVPWVPKERYDVMRAYLPTRGRLAHEMMKRTATIQANLDYSDEDDAHRKLKVAFGVTSLVTAIFANSPLVDGKDSGYQSYRAAVWLETDPDRCGLLPFVFEDGSVFRAYVEWALDVPMFFIYRDGRYLPLGGMPFGRFLAEGFEGHRATMADWELHLSTLFPEGRLKDFIEVRGADSGPVAMVHAVPALWKGLLYDDTAVVDAFRIVEALSFAQRVELLRAVPRQGLGTPLPDGRTVRDAARELLVVARDGLSRLAPDEVSALDPLDEIVGTGRVPADYVRDAFVAEKGDPARVVERIRHE